MVRFGEYLHCSNVTALAEALIWGLPEHSITYPNRHASGGSGGMEVTLLRVLTFNVWSGKSGRTIPLLRVSQDSCARTFAARLKHPHTS
jgi:hypothetical protein